MMAHCQSMQQQEMLSDYLCNAAVLRHEDSVVWDSDNNFMLFNFVTGRHTTTTVAFERA